MRIIWLFRKKICCFCKWLKKLDVGLRNPYVLDGLAQAKLHAEMSIENTVIWDKILSTADNSATGYVLEVVLKYTDKIKSILSRDEKDTNVSM